MQRFSPKGSSVLEKKIFKLRYLIFVTDVSPCCKNRLYFNSFCVCPTNYQEASSEKEDKRQRIENDFSNIITKVLKMKSTLHPKLCQVPCHIPLYIMLDSQMISNFTAIHVFLQMIASFRHLDISQYKFQSLNS